LAELFARRPGAVSYGWNPLAQYRIAAVKPAPRGQIGSTFEIWCRGERLESFSIRLPGEKNISNAAAVIALLYQFGFPASKIAEALAPFRGAARRQQELFADARFRLFDDYAHHPREIATTIAAFKNLGSRRLLVAFQPHRYTRTQHLLEEFSTCFVGADKLWLTELYAANEPEIPGVNGAMLADAVRARGQTVEFIPELAALGASVRAAMRPGDVVLFLGAGDIYRSRTSARRRIA
jgi:UDP-N-acetylmuramate--alanine ligase